jgi:uncharacterized protein
VGFVVNRGSAGDWRFWLNGGDSCKSGIECPHCIKRYIQELVDANNSMNLQFVLTGSRNLLLMQTVGQSLAGRSIQLELLPFSKAELKQAHKLPPNPWEYLWRGSYPRLYQGAEPLEWLPSYIQNYVERDVRLLTQVGDLGKFQVFLMLCAGRIGQMLNLTSLGNEVGVDRKTIDRWISVLEASYIIFLLRPYHENYHKRLVKTPKLYFWDTGLACSLLRIRSAQDLDTHYLRGGIFENMMIIEEHKDRLNQGERPHFWFWRDSGGLEKFHTISGKKRVQTMRLLYAGTDQYIRKNVQVRGWDCGASC